MPDEPTVDATPVDASAQAQAADNAAAQAQAADNAAAQVAAASNDSRDDSEEVALTPEAARKLRSEARNLRERTKAAEDELGKLRQKDMSEQEKLAENSTRLQAQLDQAQAEGRNLRVQVAASRLGVLDPDAAAKLLDWDTVTDASDMKQVERALKALIQEKPYLAGTTQSIDAGAGRNHATGDGHADMNDRLRAAAGRTR